MRGPSVVLLLILLGCGDSKKASGGAGGGGRPGTHGDGTGGGPPGVGGAGGEAGAAGTGGAAGRAGGGAGGAGAGGSAGGTATDPCAGPLSPTPPGALLGNLPFAGLHTGSCGGPAGEAVHAIVVDRPLEVLEITKTVPPTALEAVIYVRTACGEPATELGCQGGPAARITLPSPATGTYYVFVDGTGPGSYGLDIRGRLPAGASCTPGDTGFVCGADLVCGMRQGEPRCATPLCSDGMDNDGDGRTDWPTEPGCAAPDDDDEADPTPAPACANGADDDADGRTDYPADMGCEAAGDGDEADVCLPMLPVQGIDPSGRVMGDLTGLPNLVFGSCVPPLFGTGEAVYALRLAADATRLSARLENPFPSAMLHLRRGTCADPMAEVACTVDPMLMLAPAPAGTYYLFVDGAVFPGPFSLVVEAVLPMGAACDPAVSWARCDTGLACRASGTCAP